MALPPAVETVTVTYGPFPDFQGNMLDGTVTFTPISPVPVVHVPTGTPIVKRPITVSFTADTGSVGSAVLPATNASDLTVMDFSYQVSVKFRQTDAEQWPAKMIQLPKEAPTVDLDVLPAVTSATGTVVNMPAVISVAGLTGAVSAADLSTALGGTGGGGTATDAVTSTTIDTIVALTQAEYDALGSEAPRTLYVITG